MAPLKPNAICRSDHDQRDQESSFLAVLSISHLRFSFVANSVRRSIAIGPNCKGRSLAGSGSVRIQAESRNEERFLAPLGMTTPKRLVIPNEERDLAQSEPLPAGDTAIPVFHLV